MSCFMFVTFLNYSGENLTKHKQTWCNVVHENLFILSLKFYVDYLKISIYVLSFSLFFQVQNLSYIKLLCLINLLHGWHFSEWFFILENTLSYFLFSIFLNFFHTEFKIWSRIIWVQMESFGILLWFSVYLTSSELFK